MYFIDMLGLVASAKIKWREFYITSVCHIAVPQMRCVATMARTEMKLISYFDSADRDLLNHNFAHEYHGIYGISNCYGSSC